MVGVKVYRGRRERKEVECFSERSWSDWGVTPGKVGRLDLRLSPRPSRTHEPQFPAQSNGVRPSKILHRCDG